MSRRRLIEIRAEHMIAVWRRLQTGAQTRQELAASVGISPMSVTNIEEQLTAHHLLRFERPDAGRAGRPAQRASIDGSRAAFYVLDLAGRTFHLMAVDISHQTICDSRADPCAQNEERALRDFLSAALPKAQASLAGRTVVAAAAILPGPYHAAGDFVVNRRIPAMNDLRVKKVLAPFFPGIPLFLQEDVKLLSQALFGDARDDVMRYLLYMGVGVGGALSCGGSGVTGVNGVLGDVGQLRARNGKTVEETVCLGAFAGALALPVDAEEDELLAQIETLAHGRRPAYRRALAQIAEAVADALEAVMWMADPAEICIECRYAAFDGEYFIQQIETCLARHACAALPVKPRLHLSGEGRQGAVHGALRSMESAWMESIATGGIGR